MAIQSDFKIELREGILNGKRIGYTNYTLFLIQDGKGIKGKYKTRYSIIGDLGQAVMFYNAINIGNGYKKRLVLDCNKPQVLAKAQS